MFVALLMTLYAGIVPLADSSAQSTDIYSSPTQVQNLSVNAAPGTLDIIHPSPGSGAAATNDIVHPSKPGGGATQDSDILHPSPGRDGVTDIVHPGR